MKIHTDNRQLILNENLRIVENIMNPMLISPKLEIALKNHLQSNVSEKALKPTKGCEEFSSIIRKSKGQGSPILELLRKGLLAKGKSLNKLSLQGEGISLLKKLLFQCGFSQEKVERFMKELAENNPEGEINLSQFFLKIDELGQPDGKGHQSFTIDPSAMPYIESALQDLGFTPKDVDNAFKNAMIKGGGLDLDRLVINLKKIADKGLIKPDQSSSSQMSNNGKAALEHQSSGNQISNNGKTAQGSIKDLIAALQHQDSGNQISNNGKTGNDSIKGLITALEQMAGRPDNGNQLLSEVKTGISQILENVVTNDQKHGAASYLPSLAKLRLTNSVPKEQIGKDGKALDKKNPLSLLKGKGGINPNNGQQKADVSFLPGKGGSSSNLEVGSELKTAAEKVYNIRSEKTNSHIPSQATGSNFSEAINTAKQNPNSVRNPLPTYLIDQVGKQISRSVLRGEKVISLQLKPPDLGALKINMDIKNNVLKLGIVAENNSVKELLQSNVHVLKDSLVDQGIKLDKIDVQINNDFGQSLNNLSEGSKKGQKGNQAMNGSPLPAEDGKANPLSGHRTMVSGDRLLDLVA